MVLRCNR